MEEVTLQEQLDDRAELVANAEAMTRLLNNVDFKKIFQEIYIDAFAITNLYNLHMYDDMTRRRFLEKSLARSIFSKFIDDILQDGRMAMDSMKEDQIEDE